MEKQKIEISTKTTPTKALCNLMELFDGQTKRLNVVEQQFLNLSVRVSGIEGSKVKSR